MLNLFSSCCCTHNHGDLVDRPHLSTVAESRTPTCVSCDRTGQNVTYIGDVEGDWGSFCNFVDHSKGLSFRVNAEHEGRRSAEELELDLEDGWHFVFGGDAWDKGPGTLRSLDALVAIKKKCPDRVHLLFGNRDINKMGWPVELGRSEVSRMKGAPCADLWKEDPSCKVPRPCEFEFRRQELAHMARVDPESIPDSDVVKSYGESLQPGGCMWEYLQRAQLAILVGDSLFVDGEVLGPEQLPHKDLDEELCSWLEALNAWAFERASDILLHPTWDPPPTPEGATGGAALPSGAAAEGPGKPREFSIVIKRTGGSMRLGLDTEARPEDQFVTISGVLAGGAIAQWNSAHPDEQIKVGDRVTEVNGTCATLRNFTQAVADSEQLSMVVQCMGGQA